MSKYVWIGLALLFALTVLAVPAFAQCAMCKATTAGLDASEAKHMNAAIVMMVSPPVALFSTFIYLTFKHRRPPGGDE
jgi:hypothetical protein